MKFRPNARLDPSQVDDRRGRGPTAAELARNPKGPIVTAASSSPRYRPAPTGAALRAAAKRATYPQQNLATARNLSALIDQALASRVPVAPLPQVYAPTSTAAGSGLDAELAALGGEPQLSTYLRPFDEALARTREAHAAALPTIGAAYDRLKGGLAANQSEFAAVQARVAAEQVARQQQAQQQTAQLQRPVLNDLTSQFGADALGSLTGALGAEAAQQQANLTQQAQRHQSLAAEFAAQQQRSHQTRLADADLAREASVANAGVNLNSILGQIGVQRAGAERQYAGDLNEYQRQAAQLRTRAIREDGPDAHLDRQLKVLQLQRQIQELSAPEDPLLALERQVKERQLRSALTPAGSNPAWLRKAPVLAKRSPSAFAYLSALTDVNETARDALAGLQADLAEWQDDKRGGGKYVVYQGKRISPETIRSWVKLYYGAS